VLPSSFFLLRLGVGPSFVMTAGAHRRGRSFGAHVRCRLVRDLGANWTIPEDLIKGIGGARISSTAPSNSW